MQNRQSLRYLPPVPPQDMNRVYKGQVGMAVCHSRKLMQMLRQGGRSVRLDSQLRCLVASVDPAS
jgi:hypothetical protein